MSDKKIFIKTLSLFSTNIEDESLDNLYWSEYVFELSQVVDYNEAEDGWTTVSFKNGNRWILGIRFKDFDSMISTHHSVIEVKDSKAVYEFKEQ